MWLKFIKDCETNRNQDIIWTDDNVSASKQINGGNAVRCLGPDGEIFEDSAPEAIIKQLAAEDNISYKEEEIEMRKINKALAKEKRQKMSLGIYIDKSEELAHISLKEKARSKNIIS